MVCGRENLAPSSTVLTGSPSRQCRSRVRLAMKSDVLPLISVALVATALMGGCGKDPPKKPVDEPKKTTPVPSDMVFNDFVPSGGGGGIVGVKTDGGMLEGGMAAAGDPAAAEGGAGD